MPSRISILMLLMIAPFATAEERRTFTVSVDRKPSGTTQLSIQKRDDGSVVATTQADVTVRIAFITYKYAFRGMEVWKNGKLTEVATATNDNGRKHSVTLLPGREGLDVVADGKASNLKGDFWLTTYWKLPAEGQRGPKVTLLDADTGKLIEAKLERVGKEKLTVINEVAECEHYRLSGGVQVDLWFDADGRLVRQESIEEGHRTVLELSRLTKD